MRVFSVMFCTLALAATACQEGSMRRPHMGVLLLDGAAIPGQTALVESDCPEMRHVLVQKNERGYFRVPLVDFYGPCSIVLVAMTAPAPQGD